MKTDFFRTSHVTKSGKVATITYNIEGFKQRQKKKKAGRKGEKKLRKTPNFQGVDPKITIVP